MTDTYTQDINIGDIVWLKSGGPPMTVSALSPNAEVIWHIDGGLAEYSLPIECLTKEEPQLP